MRLRTPGSHLHSPNRSVGGADWLREISGLGEICRACVLQRVGWGIMPRYERERAANLAVDRVWQVRLRHARARGPRCRKSARWNRRFREFEWCEETPATTCGALENGRGRPHPGFFEKQNEQFRCALNPSWPGLSRPPIHTGVDRVHGWPVRGRPRRRMELSGGTSPIFGGSNGNFAAARLRLLPSLSASAGKSATPRHAGGGGARFRENKDQDVGCGGESPSSAWNKEGMNDA
jgi:hypothetical protein